MNCHIMAPNQTIGIKVMVFKNPGWILKIFNQNFSIEHLQVDSSYLYAETIDNDFETTSNPEKDDKTTSHPENDYETTYTSNPEKDNETTSNPDNVYETTSNPETDETETFELIENWYE
uniref:Uncharacterized protein n=1 Tax=Chromulina nebulosa TaxID=96789 RepID=A0A7S0XE23_9STRA|mmetsp:Transcript_3780/g.3392  ORF Transcript_3780/g.3392 Transcript_3780/m.3392 type:complete len:119 (+) Transcript_3780:336-692(+)